jgi:hypothetical protein
MAITKAHGDIMSSRRQTVADLRRRGLTYEKIAAQAGCSVPTVCRDVEHLRRQWRERAAGDYDAMMADEYANLEAVRAAAWESFEKSKTVLEPAGDARLLEIARRTTETIVKLLGLDDPVAFSAKRVSGEQGSESKIDLVTVIVDDRKELEDLEDENGEIRLSSFAQRVADSAKVQHN